MHGHAQHEDAIDHDLMTPENANRAMNLSLTTHPYDRSSSDFRIQRSVVIQKERLFHDFPDRRWYKTSTPVTQWHGS
jgi:capsule polysaccharide modification protein KpsS